MTDHYDADVAATALLAGAGGRMNEQLYGGHEEGSRMSDKPEITVDKALLADLLAKAAAVRAHAAYPVPQAAYDIAVALPALVREVERLRLAEARLAAVLGDTYRDDEGHLCLREMGCVGSIIDHADQLRAEALGCSAEELAERVAGPEGSAP